VPRQHPVPITSIVSRYLPLPNGAFRLDFLTRGFLPAGLVSGVAVSFFSKPLAILLGLFIAGVQFLEYKGVHIVPYTRLQSYFKSVDLTSMVQKNVAFKISLGLTFALAGFGSF
jgi:uncharacterized membrane protein (Fun14 family)